MWLLDLELYERNQVLIDAVCDAGIIWSVFIMAITWVVEYFSNKMHVWMQLKILMYMGISVFNILFAFSFYWYFGLLVITGVSCFAYAGMQQAMKMAYEDELKGIYLGAPKKRKRQKHAFMMLTPEQQEEYRKQITPYQTMRIKWYIYFPATILPSIPVMIIVPYLLK